MVSGFLMPGLIRINGKQPELAGKRVLLRRPTRSDYSSWAGVRSRSRDFLEPWEPSWSVDELSYAAWKRRLRHAREETKSGTGLSYLIFEQPHDALVGGISLSNIRRGASQSGQIGYWMSAEHAGRRMMSEALQLLVAHCFDTLLLHRVEAACIPRNVRSIRLLEKAGFRREGLLQSYLRINGDWEDHYLYAKVFAELAEPKTMKDQTCQN